MTKKDSLIIYLFVYLFIVGYDNTKRFQRCLKAALLRSCFPDLTLKPEVVKERPDVNAVCNIFSHH